jgi:hypothetical protein
MTVTRRLRTMSEQLVASSWRLAIPAVAFPILVALAH